MWIDSQFKRQIHLVTVCSLCILQTFLNGIVLLIWLLNLFPSLTILMQTPLYWLTHSAQSFVVEQKKKKNETKRLPLRIVTNINWLSTKIGAEIFAIVNAKSKSRLILSLRQSPCFVYRLFEETFPFLLSNLRPRIEFEYKESFCCVVVKWEKIVRSLTLSRAHCCYFLFEIMSAAFGRKNNSHITCVERPILMSLPFLFPINRRRYRWMQE